MPGRELMHANILTWRRRAYYTAGYLIGGILQELNKMRDNGQIIEVEAFGSGEDHKSTTITLTLPDNCYGVVVKVDLVPLFPVCINCGGAIFNGADAADSTEQWLSVDQESFRCIPSPDGKHIPATAGND